MATPRTAADAVTTGQEMSSRRWCGSILAVDLGDDADTTGGIYGQIAGAHYGADAIPQEWRERLTMSSESPKSRPSPTGCSNYRTRSSAVNCRRPGTNDGEN